MQNFRCLSADIDTSSLLAKLAKHEALWSDITVRQEFPGSAHTDTETIFLRGPASFTPAVVQEGFSVVVFPALHVLLNEVAEIIDPLLHQLNVKSLGRVLIVKLEPGGHITSHVDEGAYAEHFSRFHIALQSDHGNAFRCGDESICMEEGTAWWFDHRIEHEVRNDSERDRIHIIIDAVADELPAPRKSLRDGIGAISVAEFMQLGPELLQQHYDEIALNKSLMALKPNVARYNALESSGGLFALGAYVDGELIGYSANIIDASHLHYADLAYAQNDVLFLRKEYRKSRIGLELIRATEKAAKDRGCHMMLWHAKENTALNTLLPRLGYGVQDIMHSKGL